MNKIDFKKEYNALYKASPTKIELVEVPALNYIMCDGIGDPNNSQMFNDAIEALFSLSYTIKFMIRNGAGQIDYGVMPLEGLWWAEDMTTFNMHDRHLWKWTLMIMQPNIVTTEVYESAKEQLGKKKNTAKLDQLRFETMEEGLCAKILHKGAYDTEPATIENLHKWINDNGYRLRDRHREIYLNDVRRTIPANLKTILRQPIDKI
jgi:hypothetical protein